MNELIFTLIFITIFLVIGICAKSILYVDEHVRSIENELTIFDTNFSEIENIDKVSDFKLGSGHLYE